MHYTHDKQIIQNMHDMNNMHHMLHMHDMHDMHNMYNMDWYVKYVNVLFDMQNDMKNIHTPPFDIDTPPFDMYNMRYMQKYEHPPKKYAKF